MESNNTENKAVKRTRSKKIDWNSMPDSITIIGKGGKHLIKGKEYTVNKETGKLLIEKKVADLK
jgi:hypothetical protein